MKLWGYGPGSVVRGSPPDGGSQGTAACPQALQPHHDGWATSTRPVPLPPGVSCATRRQAVAVGFVVRIPRSGSPLACGAPGSLPGAVDRHISGWLSVSVGSLCWSREPMKRSQSGGGRE
jgi:hypothetical protein